MIDWPKAQERLSVKPDGQPGRVTFGALLEHVAGHSVPSYFSISIAAHTPAYGIMENANRLSAFIGQTCHESGGYRYTRELWGPTEYQRAYDKPGNQLGNHSGDAYAYRGAGLIQVTGRYWFDKIGHDLGIDLVGNPSNAGTPDMAVLISLEWWKLNNMNAIADSGDVVAVTKKVNPGLLGLDDRKMLTSRALEIFS